MSKFGFVQSMFDNTNKFYKTGLQQFDWYRKILGTEVLVTRFKQVNKYMDVFGSVATAAMRKDEDTEQFKYVVLINLNDMLKLFQKSINQLEFYDNNSVLQLGDVLKFSRNKQEFQYKIIEINTFSEAGFILNQYTLSGLVETNSTKEVINGNKR